MPIGIPGDAVDYTSVDRMKLVLADLGSVTTLTSQQMWTFGIDAQAEMNARLARLYTLPLMTTTVTVPILTALATDLAIYRVLSRRLFTAERLAASPWPDRYKEAQRTLEQIATGEVLLVTTSYTVIDGRTDIAEVWSTTKDYVPTFWEGPPGTSVVDEDKLEDGANARDLGSIQERLL